MSESELVAAAEGEASTPSAIADELSEALALVEHVNYNALSDEELRELLEAKDVIEELCLSYRGVNRAES